MSSEERNSSDKVFYSVFGQTFRIRVPEGTPGAITRKLEKGPNAGKEISERESTALYGKIESVVLEDGDYGKQIKITLDKNDDGKHPVLGFGVESKNGRDILKLLPAVDFENEVRIFPYKFTPEGEEREISGISIAQKDEDGKFSLKVQNFFIDPATKKFINGYPTLDWDKATEAEQKIYKIQRDLFLVEYLEKNVLPKFGVQNQAKDDFGDPIEYPADEVNPEDIPF